VIWIVSGLLLSNALLWIGLRRANARIDRLEEKCTSSESDLATSPLKGDSFAILSSSPPSGLWS
jgi:hypothetical protein